MKDKEDFLYEQFPEGFLWGAGTSAYQVEGTWNEDNRGENVWDTFVQEAGHVMNKSDARITADSYHHLAEDVGMLSEIGAHFYRFSISWSRLFPDGDTTKPSPKGLMYYNRLINALKNHSVEPLVTLYHMDMPSWLLKKGGWESKDCVRHFTEYASACYELFGDRVKSWLTLTDPWTEVVCGYERGITAPGRKNSGDAVYKIVHNMLRAHAGAYRTYKKKFFEKQKGMVSIALSVDLLEPKNPKDKSHVQAAERAMEFKWGWTAQPIFGDGKYPEVMRKELGDRLPKFTADDTKSIKGSADFFALNHFTCMVASPDTHKSATPGYLKDKKVELGFRSEWTKTGSPIMRVTPHGIRQVLNWIKCKYNDPAIYVTENGVSDNDGSLMDAHRIAFLRSYLQEMLKAIKQDGCKVAAYTYWSLMDSFEFSLGYTAKFGLYQVDFKDEARPRRAKDSARYYCKIIRNNGFVNTQNE